MIDDWMGDLQRLAEQSPDSVLVNHPMTERYWRAETMLSSVIKNGTPIGWMERSKSEPDYSNEVDKTFHLVVYLENEDEGFFDEEPSYYSVFRMGYDDYEGELVAVFADLFCFYDGKNPKKGDPNNPKIWSKAEAIEFMQHRFPEYEVIE